MAESSMEKSNIEKDPEMQTLSNQSGLTFYSTAHVEEEIVSRGQLKAGWGDGEGGEPSRGGCWCVAGEKGQMASPMECVCVCVSKLLLETYIWATKPSL